MPNQVLPEYMGYDRTIAVFSPDGRLFQVEYAKETVKRGATAVGIVFRDGVIFATVKPVSKLTVTDSIEKIFQVDDHIGAVAAGFLSDARVLIEIARIRAQVHRITYEEPIDVWSIARVVGDRMQYSTLLAGLRPFGVSILIGGVDKGGAHLLEVDPSGMLFEWYAHTIGRGAAQAKKILEQKWKEGMDEKSALALASEILKKTEKEEGKIEAAIIKKDERFKILKEEDIKKLLK
ncbi:MAG: archaeal proteasome endopeptidase complex subunit alpha [Candidatus Aenigmarchaeota archaeon]|nr:archaeal proteasome endopeptidase complex subunit alpha [Candidatus Aenigmarchaeota archaeon]